MGHAVFGHRLEHLRQLFRELREIDVAMGIDEHGWMDAENENVRTIGKRSSRWPTWRKYGHRCCVGAPREGAA
jgi:hypothetical protein